MTEFIDPDPGKMRWVLQGTEHAALRQQWPQIDYALISILKYQFQNARNNGFGSFDPRQIAHSIGPTFSCAIAAANVSRRRSCLEAAHASTDRVCAGGSRPATIVTLSMSTTA